MALPGPTTMSHQPGSSAASCARHVRIARQGVADQHGVVAGRVELAVGLVGHGHLRQRAALLQRQRLVEVTVLGVRNGWAVRTAIAALENSGSSDIILLCCRSGQYCHSEKFVILPALMQGVGGSSGSEPRPMAQISWWGSLQLDPTLQKITAHLERSEWDLSPSAAKGSGPDSSLHPLQQ